MDQLIAYSLQALQASNPDEELTSSSCSLAAVGIGMEMVEYSPEEITNYVWFSIFDNFLLLFFITLFPKLKLLVG